MNELIKLPKPKKSFDVEDFRLYANAFSQGIIIVDALGKIIFVNELAEKVCCNKDVHFTPFLSLDEFINDTSNDVLSLIHDSLEHKKDLERQVLIEDKIYLIASKAVLKNGTFHGCVLSILNITDSALKQKQQELVYQISSAISISPVNDLEQIIRITVAQIKKAISVDTATIMLIDPKTNLLTMQTDTNIQKSRQFKIGEGLAGKAAEEGKPYSAYDIALSDLYSQKEKGDKGALLVVPIKNQERTLGVINVATSIPRYFTETELQFLTIIANEIGGAISNSILYKRLKYKIALLSEIFEVSTFVVTSNLEAKVSQTIKLVPELMESEGCYVYLYSPRLDKFFLRYKSNIDKPLPNEIEASRAPVLAKVLQEQKTYIVNSPSRPKLFNKQVGINNLISSPMLIEEKPIGVITVFNKFTGIYDSEDQEMLKIIALRVASKLESAHLMRIMEDEKELFDRIIKNISEGVMVINRRKKIIVWNRYLEDLTGISSEEALGQPCYKILFNMLGMKKVTQEIYFPSPEFHIEKTVRTTEEFMKTTNGERIWIEAVSSYLLNARKHVENTIIVFRNISNEHDFMERKNEFVSLTTHELRTPLTAIKGYLSMLLAEKLSLSSRQQKYLTNAFSSTERLVKLVEEILDVVRIEEDRMKYNLCTFIIHHIINESIEELLQNAQAKNITISFQSGPEIYVFGDPGKTKQIIENLIENAIKYTKSNGKVTILVEKDVHEIQIFIQDTGVGIPKKYIHTIFDRFIRINNPLSVQAGGTGLGLYIVKNLVEKQGGKIYVISQPGKGTTFSFTIPLATVATSNNERKELL